MKLTDTDKAFIRGVQAKMKVTKVVCTRAIKTKNGDFFVGFSAAWDTIQEDAGGMGADMVDALDEGEAQASALGNGMSLKEARVAGYILAMQTDLQAQDHALAGGGITMSEHSAAQAATKRNYMKIMTEALATAENGSKG